MFLKRIELRGFKSFAGTKEIVLGPGVTGIVGPNGSGKSNICDAMRWVLGEQSSKTLRGTSLQDVIFKGTQSRPKRSACEVSLVFDNTDGRLEIPYSEVAVTRSVNRAGDSGFRINGNDVRLRDILGLFQNTGVGRDGYSIIGQGQISNILENRAQDRRAVFEEAAGVTKYRTTKEEAERNLDKTHDNMDRIQDILTELQDQLEPAREQMERAKASVDLATQLKSLEVSMILSDIEAGRERRGKAQIQLEAAEQDRNEAMGELEKAQEARRLTKRDLDKEREHGLALREKLSVDSRENERQSGVRALAEQRLKTATEQAEQLKTQILENEKACERSARELEETAAEREEASAKCAQLQGRLQELKAEEKTYAVKEAEGSMDAGTDLSAKAEAAEKKSIELQVTKAACQESLAAGRQSFGDAQERLAQAKRALEAADRAMSDAAKAVEDANAKKNVSSETLRAASKRLQDEQAALQDVSRRHAAAAAQADVLARSQRTYDGYYEGVRSLMRDALNDPSLSSHITGVIGECITVETRFETAIEIALASAMHDVVVPHDSDAKVLVEYLRSNKYGRVTFLPADALRTRYLNGNELKTLSEPGVLCAAHDAVECSPEVRPAVDHLLARTVIVKDLDTALRLKAEGRNTFRIVTVQGETVSPGGAITGGSTARVQKNFLARRRKADDAAAEAEVLAREELSLSQTCAQIEATLEAARAEDHACSELLREAQTQLGVKAGARKNAKAEEQRIAAECEVIRTNAQNLEAQFEELSQKAKEAEEFFARVKEDLEKARTDEEQRREAQQSAALALADLRTEIASGSGSLKEAQGNLHVLEEREIHLKRSIDDAARQKAAAEEKLAGLEKSREVAKRELSESAGRIETSNAKLADLQKQIEESGRAEHELENRVGLLEEAEKRIQDQERRADERMYKARTELERVEENEAASTERLWSEYELTLANAEQIRIDGFARRQGKARIEEIRGKIRDLGAVNPQAPDDYRRLKERTEEMGSQLEDLKKAEEDLKTVISDLLTQMRTIFMERFKKINENFELTFRELFGGGNARIELTQGEEIMEAGIEIMAEPPGKKLQSLSLLSGGERTLTAIALCLAMLSVNPSPVCLLDEIDAPLDDKNAIRLADYLHKMSGELQFIVITHRKTTMAVCDALYGVSMPEKGVSDIVSVRLS